MQRVMRVRARGVTTIVVIAWLGVIVAAAGFLQAAQGHARDQVQERFETRVASGATFSSLYVQDIFARESRQATTELTGRAGTVDLERAAAAVGFSASVLLDRDGRILQAAPSKAGLLGQAIANRYPHLATAIRGRAAVSNVVLSAARSVAVVGFAMPFETPSGRRVFSGAFDVARTPLGAYMSHMISTPGRHIYLIDRNGSVIASSRSELAARTTLGQVDRPLAHALAARSAGSRASARGGHYFASVAVAGTPWRLVADVPENQLYRSIEGPTRWLPWLVLAALAVTGLLLVLLGSRLLRGRDRLSRLNADLDRLARVDSLTGLRNRRDIEERLVADLSAARRHSSSVAVLLIDIDHFKHVNDTLGHEAGDAVLVTTATTIKSMLRAEDSLGRWGGEEFIAVLPDTDTLGALKIAERIRAQVAEPGSDRTGPAVDLTVMIGVAVWLGGRTDDLVSRADVALYAGKAAGRNNVQLAAIDPHREPLAGRPRNPAWS